MSDLKEQTLDHTIHELAIDVCQNNGSGRIDRDDLIGLVSKATNDQYSVPQIDSTIIWMVTEGMLKEEDSFLIPHIYDPLFEDL